MAATQSAFERVLQEKELYKSGIIIIPVCLQSLQVSNCSVSLDLTAPAKHNTHLGSSVTSALTASSRLDERFKPNV